MGSLFLLNALYGSIAGFVWAFALHKEPKPGLIYGVIVGIIIGILLYARNKLTNMEGNATKGEASFVTNTQSSLLLIATITTAIAAWIIRLIFF